MNIIHILRQNIAGKLLNHLAVFLINVMIVRLLGSSQSGIYFNQLYVFNFVAMVCSLGLDYAAIAWIAGKPVLQATIHRMLLKVVLFFFILLLLIIFVIFPVFQVSIGLPNWAIIFFISGNLMMILFQGVLSALRRFNLQNISLLVTNLSFMGYLLFIQHRGFDLWFCVGMGYGLLFFVQGLLMMSFSYKKEVMMPAIDAKAFYAHGFRIMLSSLIYFCFLRIDNFFVEKYCDAVTLSNYVQCGKVGQYFLYFSSVISSTLLPFIASEKIAATYHEWSRMMRPYFLLIVAGAVLLALFGNYFYANLFGESFAGMQRIMLVMLPGYVCLGLLTLTNAVYIGKGNIAPIFKGDLLGLMFVLLFDLLLVPRLGVMAAASVSAVGYVLVFFYLWKGIRQQFAEL